MPVPPGAVNMQVTEVSASESTDRYWKTTFETSSSVQSVLDFYEAELIPKGWTVESESSSGISMNWVENRELAPRVYTLSLAGMDVGQGITSVTIRVDLEQL
jgi:hypothetical protein